MGKRSNLRKVEKAYLSESIDTPGGNVHIDQNDRGVNIYNISQLMNLSARNQEGRILTGSTDRPIYSLSINERIEIFKRTTTLQGVITGRAKRISALNWKIQRNNKDLNQLILELKEYKEFIDELGESIDLKLLATKFKLKQFIKKHLPEVLDDLSNFNSALRRFKKRNIRREENKTEEITEWLETPNIHDTFSQFLHKYVVDLMIHGSIGIYKDWIGDALENFYLLPGGTIFPYRSTHIGGPSAFFQIIPSLEAKIYFENEIAYSNYIPVSWSSHGELPLEALINKIAESLLFDKRAADQADGTKPPEKVVIFGKTGSPMGSLTSSGDFELPMNIAEQKRIETKFNQARKEAIATLSGVGHPIVLDISKSNTFSAQQTRQDKILRDIALIYNMSNMEVNLAGGEFTSGKETSDSQKEIDQEKGVGPIIKSIEEVINRKILPFRWGYDYEFKFDVEPSETEQVELEQKKMSTGIYSVNEIREDRGDDVFPEEQYDRPTGGQQQPDGSEMSPLNVRGLE